MWNLFPNHFKNQILKGFGDNPGQLEFFLTDRGLLFMLLGVFKHHLIDSVNALLSSIQQLLLGCLACIPPSGPNRFIKRLGAECGIYTQTTIQCAFWQRKSQPD